MESKEEFFLKGLKELIYESGLDAEFLVGALDITKEELIAMELKGREMIASGREKLQERELGEKA